MHGKNSGPSDPLDQLCRKGTLPEEIEALFSVVQMTIPNDGEIKHYVYATNPRPGLFRIVLVVDHEYDTYVEHIGAAYIRGLKLEDWQATIASVMHLIPSRKADGF